LICHDQGNFHAIIFILFRQCFTYHLTTGNQETVKYSDTPGRSPAALPTRADRRPLLRRKKLLHRANDASNLTATGNLRILTKLKSSAKQVLWPSFQSRKGVTSMFNQRAPARHLASHSGHFNSSTA